MPLISRTFNVVEGGFINIVVADKDTEFYTYNAHTINGTAVSTAVLPSIADFKAFSISGSGTAAFSYTIETINDDIYEGPTPEVFTVEGSSDITDDDGTTHFTGKITVNISDEADKPILSIDPLTVREGNANKTVGLVIHADHVASFDYMIEVEIAGSGDFEKTLLQVLMPAFTSSVKVDLSLIGDLKMEVNQTDWTDREETAAVTATSDFSQAASNITIINDDGPTITVIPGGGTASDPLLLTEGEGMGSFTFKLSKAVPYPIDIRVFPSNTDLNEFTNVVPTFRIPAGETSFTIPILQAKDDNLDYEKMQKSSVAFVAIPFGTDENVYFSGNGESNNHTTTILIEDKLRALIKEPDAEAKKANSYISQGIDILIGSFEEGLLGKESAVILGKGLRAAGEMFKAVLSTVDFLSIYDRFDKDVQNAEGAPDFDKRMAAAYFRACESLMQKAAETAFSLSVGIAAGAAIAFLAGPGILAGLAVITVGAAAAVTYEEFFKPIVEQKIINILNDGIPLPHLHLSEVPFVLGQNQYQGSTKNEHYVVDNSQDSIIETKNGGYDLVTASSDFVLSTNVEALVLTSTAVKGTGNNSNNYIEGNSAKNLLSGSGGVDVLFGKAGADNLSGGTGDDTLFGDDGNDKIFGNEGNDILVGGNGSNILDGGDGADTADYGKIGNEITVDLTTGQAKFGSSIDTLTSIENVNGSLSDDVVTGNDQANAIDGREGNDLLDGAAGKDVLVGGDGNDVLLGGTGSDWFKGGRGNDTIVGGSGKDTIDYYHALEGVVVDLGISGAQSISASEGADNLKGIESTIGSAFADSLKGNGASNDLAGENGDDQISGGGGTDKLEGGGGDDNVLGDDGDDQIVGGVGRDTLTGGIGSDTFIFVDNRESPGAVGSADVILDFEHSQDKIDVSHVDAVSSTTTTDQFSFIGTVAFSAAGQVRIEQSGSDTVLLFNTDNKFNTVEMSVLLKGVATSEFSESDIFL